MTEILVSISYALAVVLIVLSFFVIFFFPLLKMVQMKKEIETMASLIALLLKHYQNSRKETEELREEMEMKIN